MSEQKADLRREMLQRRRTLSEKTRAKKSAQICKILEHKITQNFPEGVRILFYAAKSEEVDLFPLFEKLTKNPQFQCFFPRVLKENDLEAVQVSDLSELSRSKKFNLLEPTGLKVIAPEDLDIILLPAVAIDRFGNRLGFGRGFYDRFLQKVGPNFQKWAVIFSLQKVEKIPTDWHDVPVDAVVDEHSFFSFSPS